jgi:uncharacterized protein YrrD
MTIDTQSKTDLDLNIGADIYCSDGRCGKLTHVVIEPRTQRVTDLIVEKGFLQKEDRIVPISAVKDTSDDRIEVDLCEEDYESLPGYDKKQVRVPATGQGDERYETNESLYFMGSYGSIVVSEEIVPRVEHTVHEGVPSQADVLSAGTPVRNAHGDLGEVDHLLIDADTNQITHLVIETQGLFPDYPVVPIEDIKEIDEFGVYLPCSKDELGDYPRYTPRG